MHQIQTSNKVNRITLVSTTHQEKGAANVANLYSILKYIKPEVIFVELPSAHYEFYFSTFSLRILESESINMYRKDNPAQIILVDSIAPDPNLRNEFDLLFDQIDSNSAHCKGIQEYIFQFTYKYGFPYLNSEKHFEHLANLKREEFNIIKELHSPQLLDLYALWKDIHDQRENEMLHNIQVYCGKHSIKCAALLVGSAHSESLIKKSKGRYGHIDIQLFSFSHERSKDEN